MKTHVARLWGLIDARGEEEKKGALALARGSLPKNDLVSAYSLHSGLGCDKRMRSGRWNCSIWVGRTGQDSAAKTMLQTRLVAARTQRARRGANSPLVARGR
jgi:hypothetical protein